MKEIYQALADGKTIQVKVNGAWLDTYQSAVINYLCSNNCANNLHYELRVKPDMIKIGEVELNAPMRKAPPVGTDYYISDTADFDNVVKFCWDDDTFDKQVLSKGLCFSTREDARAVSYAIIKLLHGISK